MKKLVLFISIITLLVACKDDSCDNTIDNILQAKSTYEANPSEVNCFSYRTTLEGYLNSSCKSEEQQIDYKAIFQSYYDGLPCEVIDTTTPPPPPPPTDTPTCTDGVQNGDETGVDCGGANCLPCATIFINYDIAGNSANHTPVSYFMSTGNSAFIDHRFVSGNILNSATNEARVSFYLFETQTVTLTEFQELIGTSIPFETSGQDFARFKYSSINNGATLTTENAGNTTNNSSLIINTVNQLDGDPLSFHITGTFTCKAVNESGSIVDINNGEFSMVYLAD